MLVLDEMMVIGQPKSYKVFGLESSVRSCKGGGEGCLPLMTDCALESSSLVRMMMIIDNPKFYKVLPLVCLRASSVLNVREEPFCLCLHYGLRPLSVEKSDREIAKQKK